MAWKVLGGGRAGSQSRPATVATAAGVMCRETNASRRTYFPGGGTAVASGLSS